MDLHAQTVARFSHKHESGEINATNEKRTLQVVILTGITMVIEIVAGYMTGSMALLGDGWHMGTHAFALGISYSAYMLARKHRSSDLFSFGTGKFGILAGYTSALFLGMVAIWMLYVSVTRLINPVHILFDEAILVTAVGLVVNLVSIFILHQPGHHKHEDHHHSDDNGHHHDHGHTHGHNQKHLQDHNYKAAYLHVIADALTSIFALTALLMGRFFGWVFLDPVMGIVGGVLISRWAIILIRTTGFILLDGGIDQSLREKARTLIESDNESRVTDLHVWRLGSREIGIIAAVVTGSNRKAEEYQSRLKAIPDLAHLSVEVHHCEDADCPCATV